MVGYLCEQAAATLRSRQRLANGVTLTVSYADGESKVAQGRLPRLTDATSDIDVLVRRLLSDVPRDGVQSVNLKISSVEIAVARGARSRSFDIHSFRTRVGEFDRGVTKPTPA